jgi:hypothetical protein
MTGRGPVTTTSTAHINKTATCWQIKRRVRAGRKRAAIENMLPTPSQTDDSMRAHDRQIEPRWSKSDTVKMSHCIFLYSTRQLYYKICGSPMIYITLRLINLKSRHLKSDSAESSLSVTLRGIWDRKNREEASG